MTFALAGVVLPVLPAGAPAGADQRAVQQHHPATVPGDLLQGPVQAWGHGQPAGRRLRGPGESRWYVVPLPSARSPGRWSQRSTVSTTVAIFPAGRARYRPAACAASPSRRAWPSSPATVPACRALPRSGPAPRRRPLTCTGPSAPRTIARQGGLVGILAAVRNQQDWPSRHPHGSWDDRRGPILLGQPVQARSATSSSRSVWTSWSRLVNSSTTASSSLRRAVIRSSSCIPAPFRDFLGYRPGHGS